jgi:glycosyltransferase involved in cell wall biosynthesis
VIHNRVDVSRLKRRLSLDEAKRDQGLVGKFVIGSMGRLEQAKGYEYLVRVLPQIRKHHPEAVVRIAGRGPLLDSLTELAIALGASDQVRFQGFTDNVSGFLESMDIYVQPSLCEAMPLAILEASAVGSPVVASGVGGVRECVVHGETGYVVPPRNLPALSDAILRLAGNASERASMAENARRRTDVISGWTRWWPQRRRSTGVYSRSVAEE